MCVVVFVQRFFLSYIVYIKSCLAPKANLTGLQTLDQDGVASDGDVAIISTLLAARQGLWLAKGTGAAWVVCVECLTLYSPMSSLSINLLLCACVCVGAAEGVCQPSLSAVWRSPQRPLKPGSNSSPPPSLPLSLYLSHTHKHADSTHTLCGLPFFRPCKGSRSCK